MTNSENIVNERKKRSLGPPGLLGLRREYGFTNNVSVEVRIVMKEQEARPMV